MLKDITETKFSLSVMKQLLWMEMITNVIRNIHIVLIFGRKEKGHIVNKPRTCEPKIIKETFRIQCTICGIQIQEHSMPIQMKRVHGNKPYYILQIL